MNLCGLFKQRNQTNQSYMVKSDTRPENFLKISCDELVFEMNQLTCPLLN